MAAAVNPKQLAGYKAVDDHVVSGMAVTAKITKRHPFTLDALPAQVGLGTGSTAYFAVERVGQLLAAGTLKDIVCVPTSERTKEQAESLKIPLSNVSDLGR
jgi:ribose 5-phosphate isomerase A